MTDGRPTPSPQGVPTLTEVVGWAEPVRPPASPPRASEPPVAQSQDAPAPTPVARADDPAPRDNASKLALDEAELTQRILGELQTQVDLVLEYRVREILTPILTRVTDALVRDARAELSRALREVVSRQVAQELHRRQSR